ncbi:MAG: methyl-accepting chemotaxis protein [Woeseia sp.]
MSRIMDQTTEKSSAFTILVAVLVVVLLAAAATAWFAAGSRASAGPGASGLAALSQSIPLHATRAAQADADAKARLVADLERLEQLRDDSANVPGSRSDWDNLVRHGNAIVIGLDAAESTTGAIERIDAELPALSAAVDGLLQESGATAVLQGVEAEARSLRDNVARLLQDGDGAAAEAAQADVAAMRAVSTALAGGETALDIAPLPDAQQDELLAPLNNAIDAIAAAAGDAIDSAAGAGGLGDTLNELQSAADNLRNAMVATGPGGGGFLQLPWLVPALLGIALLLVIVLAIMHGRTAVFERAAKVQAEQNERNQQAILRLLDELGSLADGDLTVEATVTEDITGAIADSINYAIEKLRELVATINETAIMVDSAAKQTKNTAVHMARAADNQGREIRAATESIDSMASSIEEVSGNAERSSDVARHSVDVAHKGGEAVRRTIDGMNTIRETIQETSKRIKRLGESSQEIGNIIELINDIAEQTNILALNASIQASMAGEAGRGFAVVADEVQRLAERSTNATKQIEVLVRTIQSDTNEAVVSMERSTTDVVGGALLAENAGAALDEIEQVSNQIANLVQNISGSAREQAGSAADVTRRAQKLKEISDQTGKATAATATAISKLSILASQLRETVAGFTLPNSAVKPGALGNAPPQSPAPPQPPKVEKKAAG